ncbi:S-adenosyl-L-methionine-dependent methyltransferase [Syncephalis pseudoplumigaleata]|uniref:S-adenosyl-L-methionine-dependent methyltransferase n=1 Tax=Syncephalis pseudoplumigaleata TaxID=1712513 RepID=A0A4P9Z6T3_9FUNG|nr:S-adenosyl-L-methionine-dependent methyltransferase [Syncephalis pseudoplumigaleata]|eukprot:RKP28168.1 S-adenosyl-L-methionine-dependent methyltransferase [Syncephalis pseudoplumigaleata]
MATFSNPQYDAAAYRDHRPAYMRPVYNTIMDYHQGGTEQAMDVATGTGQAAVELAKLFTKVRATDKSDTMLSQAIRRDNITYVQEPAERIDLPDKSVDLVVTAEAAHWFDLTAFQREVQRVLTDRGTLAIWGYNVPLSLHHPRITEALNYYNDVRLESYWEEGRTLLNDLYGSIKGQNVANVLQADKDDSRETAATAPFMPLRRMTLGQLADYLRTWSPYNTWKRSANAQTEVDPVDEVMEVVKRTLEEAAIAQGKEAKDAEQYVDITWRHVVILLRK